MKRSKLSNANSTNGVVPLIMDLQPLLLGVINEKDNLLASNLLFLKAMNFLNLPFILTEQVPQKLGSTEESVLKESQGRHVIVKTSFSAFGSEQVCATLKEFRCSHLLLAGIETPICIFLTAREALVKGFSVTVISDCVGCRRADDGEAALNELRSLGAEVLPLETVLFRYLESSEHSAFRSISQLLRNR